MKIMSSVGSCLVVGGLAAFTAVAHAQPVAPAAPAADPAAPAVEPAPEAAADQPPVTTAAPIWAPAPTGLPPEVLPTTPLAAQFLTLDRQDGTSLVSVDLGYTYFDVEGGSITPLRFGLHGQYVAPSGVGGFASLALNHVRASDDDSGEDESLTGLSNIELGGLYAAKLGTIEGVARASLVLPTAPDDEDGLAGVIAGITRITDSPLLLPETTWLRLSGSPVVRRQNFILRADLGVDIAISEPENIEIDPIFRFNLAAGIIQGQHQFSAEVANSFTFGDDSDSIHSIGLSYRANLGSTMPYLGILRIFDEDGFNDDIVFSLIGGVTVPLGG